MIKKVLIFYVIFLLGSFFLKTDNQVKPELWQKAVLIAESNSKWIPAKIVSITSFHNKKGKIKSKQEIWQELYVDENNKIISREIKHIKNGKEILIKKKEEKKENTEEKKKNSFSFSLGDSPFVRKIQNSVSVEATEKIEMINSKKCSVFNFRRKINKQGEKKEIFSVGKAWIEKGTGYPVKIEFTMNPLPKYTKKFKQTLTYKINGQGQWLLEKLRINGTGGFLFIKKYFKCIVRFSNYFDKKNAR